MKGPICRTLQASTGSRSSGCLHHRQDAGTENPGKVRPGVDQGGQIRVDPGPLPPAARRRVMTRSDAAAQGFFFRLGCGARRRLMTRRA
jgi:hypothetical protein